jgi:hypothetical protein
MSAESELGTLPVSALLLSQLHTRSGLGRSAVLRRTRYPRTVPAPTTTPLPVPLQYYSVASSAKPTATAHTMHPTCSGGCAARRALGAQPTDPTLLARTRKHRWREGVTHSNSRLVSAESELGTLPVSVLWLRSLHNRSGLARSAPCYAEPTAQCPLRYPRTVPASSAWPLTLAG